MSNDDLKLGLFIVLCIVLFSGKPDIIDAVIYYVTSHAMPVK